MKTFFITLFLVVYILPFAQNTDVFLFDLKNENDLIQLTKPINISDKPTYDNQPSFINNDVIVYTSTNGKQTDIAEFDIKTGETRWVCTTTSSEFSPTKITGKNAISAIRQGIDGSQKLFQYDLTTGRATPLIEDLLIGYHVWGTKNTIFTAILENGQLSLSKTNLKSNHHKTLKTNIGRSLHRIPNTDLISYVDKTSTPWTINSLHIKTGVSTKIIETKSGVEDYCWTSNGVLLMGYEGALHQFDPKKDTDWKLIQSLKEFGLKNSTRINVNKATSKLVLVAEKTETNIPKIEELSWITGNWKGNAFDGIVEENWSEPSGGSMMATFKLIVDNKVVFYELEIIREINNTLVLQLKHFNSDLVGWETKEETIDFPLIELTENKAVFEGMIFERISATQMNVSVDLKQKDGSIKTLTIEYSKD